MAQILKTNGCNLRLNVMSDSSRLMSLHLPK